MANKNDLVPTVSIQYLFDLTFHLHDRKGWRADPTADGQDLNRKDADVTIGGVIVIRVELGEEVHVGVQADANTVNNENGSFALRLMTAVPVAH